MKEIDTDLEVQKSGRNIAVSNGQVLLKLIHKDGGYVQEFHGFDRSKHPRMVLSTIHRNLIPFTEHRLTSDPMLITRRRHLFAVSRDSLRMAYSDVEVTQSEGEVTIKLSGKTDGVDLSSTITIQRDSKFVHVTVAAEFTNKTRPPILEYLMANYAFLPDQMLHSEYERPDYAWTPSLRPEDDHVIGERSFKTPAAVVQCGKLMAAIIPDPNERMDLPVALDLDLKNGLLWAPLLSYGFCDTKPNGAYSKHDFSMLLKPDSRRIEFGFDLYVDADAKIIAGYTPIQEFAWDRAVKRSNKLRVHPTPPKFTNNLPSAYVIKSTTSTFDELLLAERTIERVLRSQKPEGVFDLGEPSAELYDTETMTEASRWLLAIHRDFGPYPELLKACKSYGDFLVSSQLPSGAIPSNFTRDLNPGSDSRTSALTASAGRFLAELYEETGEKVYLSTAIDVAKFISNLVCKLRYRNRHDHSPTGMNAHDPHTLILPLRSDAARCISEMFIALHRITGDQKYLKSGLPARALMCWFQDTWTEKIGAFGLGNAHTGDADHAVFGKVLLEYYAATNNPEFIQRGVAAINAGLREGHPSAYAVQLWATKIFGSAIVDLKSRTAYAIGPCSIDQIAVRPGTVDLAVKDGFTAKEHPLTIKFAGLRSKSYLVTVNGKGKRYPKVELETGISITL